MCVVIIYVLTYGLYSVVVLDVVVVGSSSVDIIIHLVVIVIVILDGRPSVVFDDDLLGLVFFKEHWSSVEWKVVLCSIVVVVKGHRVDILHHSIIHWSIVRDVVVVVVVVVVHSVPSYVCRVSYVSACMYKGFVVKVQGVQGH